MKRFKRGKKGGFFGTLVFGLIINLIVFGISILICALIISTMKNPLQATKLGSVIALFISGAISGAIISLARKEGSVASAFVSALLFSLILLAIGVISASGTFPLINALNYAVYSLIALAFARLCQGFGRKRHRTA